MSSVASFDDMDAFSMHTKLEDSQSHIANLLEMLALENYADESASVSYMMNSMGNMLGKFSENHSEIESEMNEMLESSRRGLLTHGEVADLIANEATRSYYLSNILDGLKFQIESMHEVLAEMRDDKDKTAIDNAEELRHAATHLASKMNMILKTVDSMDRLVASPAKKVQQAVAVIDSEVVMHVNKTQLGSNTNKNDAKEKEKEKVEKAERKAAAKAAAAAVPLVQLPSSSATSPKNSAGATPLTGPAAVAAAAAAAAAVAQASVPAQAAVNAAKPPLVAVKPAVATRTVGIQANLTQHSTVPAVSATPGEDAKPVATTVSTATSPHNAEHHADEEHLLEHGLHSASNDDDSQTGKPHSSTPASGTHHKKGAGAQKKHPKKRNSVAATDKSHHNERGSQKHGHAADHHDAHDTHDTAGSAGSAHHGTEASKAHGGMKSAVGPHVPVPTPIRTVPGIAHHDAAPSSGAVGVAHTSSVAASTTVTGLPEGATTHEALRGLSLADIVSKVLRAQALEAVDEQRKAESEVEIKKRVKQALTAAANKDYAGFAHALGSKSPHSRQTYAKYTGRPVSQEGGPRAGGSGGNLSFQDESEPGTATNTARGLDGVELTLPPNRLNGGGSKSNTNTGSDETSALDLNSGTSITDTIIPLGRKSNQDIKVDSSVVFDGQAIAGGALSDQGRSPANRSVSSNLSGGNYHNQQHQGPGPAAKPALSSLSVLSAVDEHTPVLTGDQTRGGSVRVSQSSSRQQLSARSGTPLDASVPEENQEPDTHAQPENPDDSQYGGNNNPETYFNAGGGSLDTNSQWGARLPAADMALFPSQSLQLGSLDIMDPSAASALLAGKQGSARFVKGKLVIDDSNVSEKLIGQLGQSARGSSMKNFRGSMKRTQEEERRLSMNEDDNSANTQNFRQFAAAELKQEQEERTALGIDSAPTPSRVDMFNQIFQTTKDPKKLEMIRINAPQANKLVDSGTCTSQDKMGFATEAQVEEKLSPAEPPTGLQLVMTSLADMSASEIMLPGRVPPGHSSVPPSVPRTPVHRNAVPRKFNDSEMQNIKDALSKVVDADASSYLLSQLEGIFAESANAANARMQGGYELPIYDNQGGILLTRTYREQAPAATFYELLSSSSNPLLHLHQEYASFLSKTHRVRLLNAAVMEDRVKIDLPQSKTVQTLLALLLEAMLSTVAECNEMLSLLKHCESRVGTMVELLKRKPDYHGAVLASPQLAEVYSSYGIIEALEISVDMKLIEFRSLFERINAQSLHELDNLMKESTDFEYCYKHFVACQGKAVESKQRMAVLHDRCERYQLGANLKKKPPQPQKQRIEFDDQTSVGMTGPEQLLQDIADLRDEIESLKEELATAREEYEDQEVEMMEMLTERDRSPDALIFFSIMHDPSYMQNLHQLVLQMKHLKSFADGTGHMDFLTLRKRIQVCVVLTPNVEKLVDRYAMMYQKWSTFRLNWFSERKLNGGSADAFNSCPLCFQGVSAAVEETKASGKAAVSQKLRTLVVNGRDSRALRKQSQDQKLRTLQNEQVKQLRTTNFGVEEMSTLSSPDRARNKTTLPHIK